MAEKTSRKTDVRSRMFAMQSKEFIARMMGKYAMACFSSVSFPMRVKKLLMSMSVDQAVCRSDRQSKM
ncbi:MAG: hypothetical protein IJ771_04735 [Clostridia bacterium]|nr:hypothetical protein [Clostridia bacterium]